MAATSVPVYDRIGHDYCNRRREEPRITTAIREALGDAPSVLNVGAGCGSYEPPDRHVVALEPSAVMLRQRLAGAAPAVRAVAEALPFADGSFGAAMGVLTVHHWRDRARGLAEMRRVARGPVVLFIGHRNGLRRWWLHEYFPATERLEANRGVRADQVAGALGGQVTVVPVPIPAECADGFNGAYWRRPASILDPAVWRSMSALSLIPDADRAAGMRRLKADLDSGEWHRRWGHLLSQGELDLGYGLVIARP
jgi:SAM-dependent methyltransferase